MLKRFLTGCLLLVAGTSFGQSAAARYIEMYKEEAVKRMNEYGVPASIILGVAMHESGSGTSRISKYLNNHFGMKGQTPNKKIRSAYKGYDSVSQSYTDFVLMLKNRSAFTKLFEKHNDSDYLSWARGIQKGGYAHSRSWSRQVLAIIEKYQLYRYDNRPQEPAVFVAESSPEPAPAKPESTIYKVKKGDTLLALAKRFKTNVKSIKANNNLRSNNLSIGQRLRL
jgi:LysM repeat protein